MIEVPFKFTGQSGTHKAKQFSSEKTQNMYLDFSESAARQGAHDFPGLKLFANGGGADRGWHEMAGVLYVAQGTALYRVEAGGGLTSLGSVPGNDRAIFADDGTNLYFVANGALYKYNGTSISTVSQSVIGSPSWVAYINKQFILGGDGQTYAVSNVGDGNTWNALNVQDAEVSPDDLIRGYVFTQLVYMLGAKSTEPHYNSGVGNPPFDRQDTALVNVGIAGKHAVTNTDSFMYFLGDDRKFYQVIGASSRPIPSANVSDDVDAFSVVSDCIASSVTVHGQNFVLFSFPTASKTYLYSETYNYWVDVASGTDLPTGRWRGNSVRNCYGKALAVDYATGDIYELDKNTFTDNSEARLRIRELPSFTGALINRPGSRITVGRVKFNMQVGVGLATGQGSDPVIMCQLSPDGGETWRAERQVSIGVAGNYTQSVSFDDFCTGYEVKCRVLFTDPVLLSIFDGVVELEAAGY